MIPTPVRNRIVVKPFRAEDETKSGLYIPGDTEEQPRRGKVVRTGAGALSKSGNVLPMTVQEGDTVVYPKETGQSVNIDNQEYVILVETQIIAVEE